MLNDNNTYKINICRAKGGFGMDEVKGLFGELEEPIYTTFLLVGLTVDGETFTGEQEIKIIDINPKGQ